MPARLVAIGDLHGDIAAARRALRLAGAIGATDAWIGKDLGVVQTGDEIDRGDDDRAILDLLEKLKTEAAAAGGEVVAMLGNHEIMNAQLDFRYVTPGAFPTFEDVKAPNAKVSAEIAKVEPEQRPRAAAFAPGGRYAELLARRPVVARIGDTLFTHGGVLPKHVTYGLARINEGASDWLLGKSGKPDPPAILTAEDGPLWSRAYSAAPGREECAWLDAALASLGAKRLVMGHTVQRNGINPACGGKGWRIDVGLAKVYGGKTQVLELKGDAATVLEEGKSPSPP